MSMSSRPSLLLNSPQTSSSDSIKFQDFFFFFCLFCGWVRGLGLDRPRQRQEVFQKNLFGDMFLLAWLLFLFTLCSDVLCPPTNSLSKVSFNFFFFPQSHTLICFVCLPLYLFSSLNLVRFNFLFFFLLFFFPCLLITFLLLESAQESHSGTMNLAVSDFQWSLFSFKLCSIFLL